MGGEERREKAAAEQAEVGEDIRGEEPCLRVRPSARCSVPPYSATSSRTTSHTENGVVLVVAAVGVKSRAGGER